MSATDTLSKLFLERREFVVIGLTGRTGSGCTTAAKILSTNTPDFPKIENIRINNQPLYQGLDARRYTILKQYTENNWSQFFSIKVSDLISAYLLSLGPAQITDFICKHGKIDSQQHPLIADTIKNGTFSKCQISKKFRGLLAALLDHSREFKIDKRTRDSFELFFNEIIRFTADFKKDLANIDDKLYINLYQAAGKSIRKTGKVTSDYIPSKFEEANVFALPESINKIIKIIRQIKDRAFIVIDAIRNPYEARFFRDRYSAFYLVSINAPDEDREAYLSNVHKFTKQQLKELEEIESGEKGKKSVGAKAPKESQFVNQNVKKCIEMSDIHIINSRAELENTNILRAQLAWYFALMMHPGLVSPTSMERVMQIAYTAKSNSGCISRQVGAVITDKENSIKAVGWNDVAQGQVPCSLRSLDGLLDEFDAHTYSYYERTDEKFRPEARKIFTRLVEKKVPETGRPLSYCFKDLKNSIDEEGNQVHTRSLHAEENAFLQITKYGGQAIKGGKLYTTASPCELCAKKAYQLEISEVVFIDPYPGIAKEHILSVGSKAPHLTQFRGAVGKGYHQLYEPMMAYKDEVKTLDT